MKLLSGIKPVRGAKKGTAGVKTDKSACGQVNSGRMGKTVYSMNIYITCLHIILRGAVCGCSSVRFL